MSVVDSEQRDKGYRTCATCGGDCKLEPMGTGGLGVRVVFSCPQHGVQTIVDRFSDRR